MGKRDVRVSEFPTWIFALFPFFFVALWLLVCFLIAQSGWNRLREFAITSRPQGRTFWMESASIGSPRYKGALIVVVAREGLFLQPILPFRAFHAPLLIPWRVFASWREEKSFWLSTTAFSIRPANNQTVLLTFESKALRAAVVEAIEAFRVAPH